MTPGFRFRPSVLAARERLATGREKLHQQHLSGAPGIQLCAHVTDLLDAVVLDIYESALADLDEDGPRGLNDSVVLVAFGGYGRRDASPFSDVDLMLLHTPATTSRISELARRLVVDLSDVGFDLGFNVRTIAQACQLSMKDPVVFTSLVESRNLAGNSNLFAKFQSRFRWKTKRRIGSLIHSIEESRRSERRKYGETVYQLEPNVKRSRGGLRDIQLLRWIGFARYGEREPEVLQLIGMLSKNDQNRLRSAMGFLLRLRNELHFHAGHSYDVLDKGEQLRLTKLFGYEGDEGVLPVERFMQDYFRYTADVRDVVTNFVAAARLPKRMARWFGPLLSHRVEGDFRVGPNQIAATQRGLKKVCGDPSQVLRLMDLANLYDKWIDAPTWNAIRDSMASSRDFEISDDSRRRFLSVLSQPARLSDLLRRLHELRVLEKLIPGLARTRGLLQFNEYHRYTVDEHCLRSVERATEFLNNQGPLGQAYRSLKRKRTLHLALLLHDLGKGYVEDHSEVGRRIAVAVSKHLKLHDREAEKLEFLVHHHLMMSHLAFRRDTSDESLVVQFAVDVGTPDLLKMLYVLTCADLAAVGPGVLNNWKVEVLTELYHRTMNHLAGETPSFTGHDVLQRRRDKLRNIFAQQRDVEWFHRQIDVLPGAYLHETRSDTISEQLERLHEIDQNEVAIWAEYFPETNVTQYTVGTYEHLTPGIFYKLTGALTSQALKILSAQIHTLADGLVLDRFFVFDPDYQGRPPEERLLDVQQKLEHSLLDPHLKSPNFRSTWNESGSSITKVARFPTRVRFDNSTSEQFTILDVFTHDRMGLLYVITRALFEVQVSVSIAKIGTYVDQVVDVFYVTDRAGQKITNERRIEEIKVKLLDAIDDG